MSAPRKITNPFPGLRPFETEEYRLFFGREGQSDALLERLSRAHFLAVVGTSGSGKSSLVRAGMLPALRGGMMAGAGSGWRIAVMRPGNDPFGELADALGQEDVLRGAGGGLPPAEGRAVIEATLRGGSLGLVGAARGARLSEHEKLLVVVDQFEELFRFRAARPASSTGDDASAFVKLLLEAARQREMPIYVVLTMRSDFLGDCAQFQGLPEAINDGQYLIPRMTRDERRVAITGPVGVTRGKMTEPLVNRLLNDVGDNPDQLPILQHALMRTWDYWAAHRREREPIGLEHYEAIGTMSDALSLHADEAWDELPDERSRLIAELLFKALTERGADNREIRRPTRLSEICAITGASAEEAVSVIEIFRRAGRSFLMPPAGTPLAPETVIDISHESLIRNWERLKKWVDEEAQSARIYRRVAEAATLYRAGQESLVAGAGLQVALDWREKARPNAAWAARYHPEYAGAMTFLDESKAAEDAAAAERERQLEEQLARDHRELEQAQRFAAEQQRAAQRLRRMMFGLVLVSLLALGAAGGAVYAMSKARSSEALARSLNEDLKSSLQQVSDARADADRRRVEAEAASARAGEARAQAEADEERAQAAEDKAEAASVEARKQAELAKAEAAKARSEQQRAENAKQQAEAARQRAEAEHQRADKQAQVIQISQQANEDFREGSAAAERREYKEAAENFDAAIQRFEQILQLEREGRLFEGEEGLAEGGGRRALYRAAVTEGMADAYVQRGSVNFDAWKSHGPLEENSVQRAMLYFDKAADLYNSYDVAAPDKAAEAAFTLGELLNKFADDPSKVFATSFDRRQGVLHLISWKPALLASAMERKPIDEERLRRDAAFRYRRAFEHYKQAGDRAGMMDTAYKIGSFYSRFAGADDQRQAVRFFEELRALLPEDADSARLSLRLGELYLALGDKAKSDEYFEQAVHGIIRQEKNVAADRAYVLAGDALAKPSSLTFYEKALEANKVTGDLKTRADALSRISDLHRAAGDEAAAARYSRQSFESFKQAYERGDLKDNVEALLALGSRAIGEKDYQLALGALSRHLQVDPRTAGVYRNEPQAYLQLGEVYYLTNQPEKALEFYERGLWSGCRDALHGMNPGASRAVENIRKIKEHLRRQGTTQPQAPARRQPSPKP